MSHPAAQHPDECPNCGMAAVTRACSAVLKRDKAGRRLPSPVSQTQYACGARRGRGARACPKSQEAS